jgi:nuclear GTP-binding protein
VETEPFADTFGPKAQRKRPRLNAASFQELLKVEDDMVPPAEGAEPVEPTQTGERHQNN